MYKILILAMLSLAIFGCLQSQETIVDESTTIAQDEMVSWWFDGKQGEKFSIEVDVTSGGPVDIYLVDSDGYADYNYNLGGGVQDFIVEDQDLGTSDYTANFEIVQTGKYYLVVDNTEATQGTSPTGSVIVKTKIIKN